MKSLLRQPAFWLAAIAVFSFANSYAAHGFRPVNQLDTADYREFDWSSLEGVLSNKRTPGYPLFLDMVESAGGTSAVPLAHWVMLIAASLVFYHGATQAGVSRSAAVFAAGAIMLSRGVLKFGALVTADSLAISLSIASAGCFFATLAPMSRRGAWTGLTLLTFLTCLTRPAYLFLIPLWPLLGFGLDRCLIRRDATIAVHLRRCAAYVAATIGPFVCYSLLRLVIVGHFGLVSFGGYNFVGIVGQFLKPESVSQLSDELQPLAQAMLEQRGLLAEWEPPLDFYAMERMYNLTVWQLAVPAAEDVQGDASVDVNTTLARLGKELLLMSPRQYVQWLCWNGWHAVVQIVTLTALDRATVVLLLLLLLAHLVELVRGPARDRSETRAITGSDNQRSFVDLHLIFWTSLAFAIAKALLVVLVEPANDRYMAGAMVLLPGALALVAGCYICRVWPAIRLLDIRES